MYSLLHWVYREVFHCCRRVDNFFFSPEKKDTHTVAVTDLPWMWVGGRHSNGTIIDYTDDVNTAITYGTIVTPEWLDYVFNVHHVQWRYLDPKTLEESEFPSMGFVINDPLETDPSDSDNE